MFVATPRPQPPAVVCPSGARPCRRPFRLALLLAAPLEHPVDPRTGAGAPIPAAVPSGRVQWEHRSGRLWLSPCDASVKEAPQERVSLMVEGLGEREFEDQLTRGIQDQDGIILRAQAAGRELSPDVMGSAKRLAAYGHRVGELKA